MKDYEKYLFKCTFVTVMNAACQHAHKQDHYNQHFHEKFCFRMISQEYLFIRTILYDFYFYFLMMQLLNVPYKS